jgi:small-conductance mechanosensitive channel
MLPEDIGVTPDLEPIAVEIRLLISLAIICGGLAVRFLVLHLIRGAQAVLSDSRRRWMISARNILNALVVLGLFVVWAPEIEEFALSITAFVVALVIATKELILCLSGATWRHTSRAFAIGDWVEIGGHSGEVIDETLFVTQLQEIEKREYRYTGRTVAVPNSLLLTQPVVNNNFRKRFLEHEFTLHVSADAPAPAIRDAIAAALEGEFATFETVARRYASIIEKRAGVKLPDVAPTVRIETNVYGILCFRCALFCPRERAGEIEQVAARAMLATRARQPARATEAAAG